MNIQLICLLVISVMFVIGSTTPTVFAQQIIPVNSTIPCFLNATAGIHMWQNCGADKDFISFALLPFEWITGGYFSMMLIALLILGVYIKYQKVIYAVGIGTALIPFAFYLFPDEWFGFIMICVTAGVMGGIIWMIREQIR